MALLRDVCGCWTSQNSGGPLLGERPFGLDGDAARLRSIQNLHVVSAGNGASSTG